MPLVSPCTDLHAENQLHRRNKDLGAGRFADVWIDPNPWFKDVLPGFRHLPPSEVLPGHDSASEYGSVCINTAVYLPWLVGQLLRNGVVVKRAVLGHISDAAALSHTGRKASIIVNATGLGSLKLGGVEDTKMAPARGQVVLVRNEADPPGTMLASTGTDDGDKDVLYMMQRAAGGGTILGGTYDKGNWESQPDLDVANRIMSRVVEARPSLAGGKGVKGLSVVRHAVGLRPYREGGVRVEREKMGDGVWVVHNYGHAGWGYQGSYGCAEDVVRLVEEIGGGKVKAKL